MRRAGALTKKRSDTAPKTRVGPHLRVASALPPQPLAHLEVPVDRRVMHWLPPVVIARAHVFALRRSNEPLRELEVPFVRCHMERLVAFVRARPEICTLAGVVRR